MKRKQDPTFQMELKETYLNEWEGVCSYCTEEVQEHYALNYESTMKTDKGEPLGRLEILCCEQHVTQIEPRYKEYIVGLEDNWIYDEDEHRTGI